MELRSFVDDVLDAAIAASGPDGALCAALDRIPAPIYVTNSEGYVVHFNPWCSVIAGRMPQAGKDRWCVTWKLFTLGGEALPHEACPMAEAIRGRRSIRGVTAVAQRPDGTQVTFMPFPTPLFATDGELTGAVNMLVDITERRQADDLRRQAERCLWLAGMVGDPKTAGALELMAMQYRIKASALDLLDPAA
jgi:PAS domain-containing protein